MFCVITLHIPDPPPVQNKTLPLKSPGWNTAVDKAATGGGACSVLGLGTVYMMGSVRVWLGGALRGSRMCVGESKERYIL